VSRSSPAISAILSWAGPDLAPHGLHRDNRHRSCVALSLLPPVQPGSRPLLSPPYVRLTFQLKRIRRDAGALCHARQPAVSSDAPANQRRESATAAGPAAAASAAGGTGRAPDARPPTETVDSSFTRVFVALRAGARSRGLGHRPVQLERVAAGAAAILIAGHSPQSKPPPPPGAGAPSRLATGRSARGAVRPGGRIAGGGGRAEPVRGPWSWPRVRPAP